MSFPADQHYFRGQGRLYLGDRDGVGGVTKLRFLGNVPELVIETPQSYDSHTESYTGRRYVDLRVLSETRINVSLILENISYENWVFATKGMFAAEPSASVSDELHLADGAYIALDYKTTAEITSVTSPDGLILYEEGIDYEIAPPSSLIHIIPNSDLAGQPFHVNYLAGDAETIAAIVDYERQYYLYFDGLNTVNRRSRVTVEIFKIQFPIASQLGIISDKFLSLQLDGVALYDVTREADGGFFKVTRETPYLLIADKELVTEGDTFIVAFYGEAPTDYIITGVESADIGGEPLTGTFNNSGEQLTFTATVTSQKDFVLSLDNGKSSVGVYLVRIVNSLSVAPSTVNQNQSFVVTFNTNYNWAYGYTITGVTSADINGLPLTGTFNNDGDTLTLTATNAIDKAFTLALNDGSDLVNVTFDYIPQLYQLTSDLSFIVEGDTFTITFTTDDQESVSFPYTITGVESANIDNAPLTGTFTGNGDTATFTLTDATDVSNFILSLDGGQASINLELTKPLVSSIDRVTYLDYFTITFRTNTPGTYPYTITGVNSADINNDSLSGTFYNDGDSVTFRATQTDNKSFTLALDNTSASVDVVLYCTFYCPQTVPDYAIIFTIVYVFDSTNYCPQTVPDYSFAQAP